MKRRNLLIYMPFGALALMECAQAAPKSIAKTHPAKAPTVAAPYIAATQMVEALLQQHFVPAALALQTSAQALEASLQNPQTLWTAHRPLWTSTLLAWETLAAVAVGPLLERRSARAIDFWPTRPAQIQRLLDAGLASLSDVRSLETVGAGARGLPALEWLLFKTPGSGHARPLALLLAQQVRQEADTLLAGYQQLARTEREESEAWALYGEWFGQAVGGLEQLRIKKMVLDTRGKDSSPWVRGLSGQTAASWLAQARGLQAFLVGTPAAQAAAQQQAALWPVPGSVNSLLLGRGHLQRSQTLLQHTAAMVQAVAHAQVHKPASLRTAQAALSKTSALMDTLAGQVLNITLGFTDADGD
jgi:predicted lipoprotein